MPKNPDKQARGTVWPRLRPFAGPPTEFTFSTARETYLTNPADDAALTLDRRTFLRVVALRTPQVLKRLRALPPTTPFDEGRGGPPAMIPSEDELRTWARGFNLDVDWVLVAAWFAYVNPSEANPGFDDYGWKLPPWPIFESTVPEGERTFTATSLPWDPELESREHFEKKSRALFERELREFVDRVEVTYLAKGFHRSAPRREERANFRPQPDALKLETSEHRHFEWLAAFQVEDREFQRIAGLNGSADGIRSAVRALAAELALPLRTERPNRPDLWD